MNFDAPESPAIAAALGIALSGPPQSVTAASWAEEDAARRAQQDHDDAGSAAAWRDPVPFIQPAPAAALPPAMAGTLVGRVAAMVGERRGFPELLAVQVCLGVLAAATRGAGTVQAPDPSGGSGGPTFPVALYLLGLAEPGQLKSPVLSALAEPLRECQARESQQHGHAVAVARATAAALAEGVSKARTGLAKARTPQAAAELDAAVRAHREAEAACVGVDVVAVGADVTYERLVMRAADNGGKVAVLSAEGALIENLAGRYSDGNAKTEFLNSAFDGESFLRERVGSADVSIDKPWTTLLQVLQPDVLSTMLGSGPMARRGFLARFLIVSAPPQPYRARHGLPPLDAVLLAEWGRAVAAVWARSAEPWVLGPGPGSPAVESLELLIGERHAAAGQDSPLYAGWLSKFAMTAERVAAVIQLGQDAHSSVLGAAAGAAAAGYGRAVIAHAEHLFCGSRSAAEASPRGRVLAWLTETIPPNNPNNPNTTPRPAAERGGSVDSARVVRGGHVSTREVHLRFKDQAWCEKASDVRAVLADLAALGWLDGPHRATGPNGGRPAELWHLHPRLAHHYARMMEAPR